MKIKRIATCHLHSQRSALTLATALLVTGISAGPAMADQIDGHWCHKDGRRLSINGPTIVTPGGTKMSGDYDRHGFKYVIPPKEPGAGKTVIMRQLNDQTMVLMNGPHGNKSVKQTWKRCGRPGA